MNINKTSILLLLLSSFIFGCNPPAEKAALNEEIVTDETPEDVKIQQAIYDEIMEVHDEMMPKMEDLMNLKGELMEKNATLEEAGLETDGTIFTSTIEMIESADESMMDWMRNFEPMNDGQSHEEIMEYYTLQKSKMDSVKLIMQNALDSGARVLSDQ